MSTKKDVFTLKSVYEKIIDGSYDYDTTGDPGTLWTWGDNNIGQLGDNTTINRSSPIQIAGTTWIEIAGGGHHSLARKSDGTLWAWGCNSSGQLGDNTTIHRSSPVQIAGTTWIDIVANGWYHSLARKSL